MQPTLTPTPSITSASGPPTPAPGIRPSSPNRRRRLGVIVGFIILGVLMMASVAFGSRMIPLESVWQALVHFDPLNNEHLIVRELRVPRTLIGILVGGALGVAGAVMQAITRNPLAEPGLLGVNAGAAAAVVTGIAVFGVVNTAGYIWFAFIGAAIAAVVVYALGGAFADGSNPIKLLLSGAALSVVLGAYTSAIVLNYASVFASFRFWAVGSLQGRSWSTFWPVLGFIVCGIFFALLITRSLNALAMGKEMGVALGVSGRGTWIIAAIVVVLLAGGATAAAGPIGFIGLTAPLIARSIVGPDYRWMLPYSILIAANVLLAADILGRLVAIPSEVQTAIVTAIIGGPFFIALVRKRKMARL